MKMKPEHYAALAAHIKPLDTQERRAAYIAGNFLRADKCKDRDMRYRWDLLYLERFPVSPLYEYLNDTHIDTALRSIVPPL